MVSGAAQSNSPTAKLAQWRHARWNRRANALVEYRFTNKLGIHAGYDWLRLNVNRTRNSAEVGIELRFMGPTVGMTLAF